MAGELRPRRQIDLLCASCADATNYDEAAAAAYGKIRATLGPAIGTGRLWTPSFVFALRVR